jgi:hypothetical protein
MGELAIEASEEGVKGETERSVAHQSGRYSIGQQREDQTVSMTLQPTAANTNADGNGKAKGALSVHQISEEELAWIEERTQTSRRPDAKQSSTPPAAVFHKAASEDEPPTLSALRPYYREPTLERVQLQFEDKSLDPTQNPLSHSSLQPPPKRRFGSAQSLLTGVGALALVGVGYLAALANSPPDGSATTTFAPASAPAQAPSNAAMLPQTVPSEPAAPEPSAVVEAAAPAPSAGMNETDVPWSVADRGASPDAQLEAAAAEGNSESALGAQAQAESAAPETALPRRPRGHVVARPTPVPVAGLPPLPSREQIQAGIEGMRAALLTCAGAAHGTTTARLTILGTGRVASATIEGAFAGSSQGSCMARALRTATFPRFAAENLQVTYPFRL